ncbi:MAG: hypothetical protein AAGA66_14120, partial [Bacteroidota bacterium]
MRKLNNLLLLAIGAIIIASCSSEDDTPAEPSNFAIFIVTDTETGSGFLVPIDSLPEGDLDINEHLTKGIQLASTRFAGNAYDGAIYAPANPLGDPGVQKFELDELGRLADAGFIPFGAGSVGSGPTYGFATSSKGYYSNHTDNQKALQIFDLNTMTRTGEIDCSAEIDAILAEMDSEDAAKVVGTGFGGFMLERDGKFFTQLFFTGEDTWEVVDKTFVAVFDVATDQLEKIIEWDDFIRIGYYSCINCNYASIGDDNNIYLSGFIGNFTDPEGPNYRSIRIKSGETDFDTDWDINGNRGDFTNGENFALGSVVHNGKMYVKMFDAPVDVTWAMLQ